MTKKIILSIINITILHTINIFNSKIFWIYSESWQKDKMAADRVKTTSSLRPNFCCCWQTHACLWASARGTQVLCHVPADHSSPLRSWWRRCGWLCTVSQHALLSERGHCVWWLCRNTVKHSHMRLKPLKTQIFSLMIKMFSSLKHTGGTMLLWGLFSAVDWSAPGDQYSLGDTFTDLIDWWEDKYFIKFSLVKEWRWRWGWGAAGTVWTGPQLLTSQMTWNNKRSMFSARRQNQLLSCKPYKPASTWTNTSRVQTAEKFCALLLSSAGIQWFWGEICRTEGRAAVREVLWSHVLTLPTSELWDQYELLLQFWPVDNMTHPNGSPTTRNATSVTSASFRISSAPCSTRSLSARISSIP